MTKRVKTCFEQNENACGMRPSKRVGSCIRVRASLNGAFVERVIQPFAST